VQAARAEEAPVPQPAAAWVLPEAAQLQALEELVGLGYFRGIVKKLDEIEADNAAHAGFVAHLRGLARQFQLDAMTRILRQARHDRETS
jgi:hypothetical protein